MTSAGVAAEVRMVLGVARLGEADLRGWWTCHGLDRAGSFVLGRAFPRTSGLIGEERSNSRVSSKAVRIL